MCGWEMRPQHCRQGFHLGCAGCAGCAGLGVDRTPYVLAGGRAHRPMHSSCLQLCECSSTHCHWCVAPTSAVHTLSRKLFFFTHISTLRTACTTDTRVAALIAFDQHPYTPQSLLCCNRALMTHIYYVQAAVVLAPPRTSFLQSLRPPNTRSLWFAHGISFREFSHKGPA